MKIKYLLLVFLIISISNITHGQSQLLKGYIINNNSDTIYGIFKAKEKFHKGSEIEFKINYTEPVLKTYSVKDIKGFYLTDRNEFYLSKNIDVYVNSDNKKNIPSGKINQNVFFKRITTGNLNLYSFYDVDNKIHFYIGTDESLSELYSTYTKYNYIENGKEKEEIIVEKVYLNVLKSIFIDCNIPKSRIDHVVLTIYSLRDIVEDYNRRHYQTHYKSTSSLLNESKIKLAIYLSYNISSWNFTSDYEIFSSSLKKQKTHISAGIDVIFQLPYYPNLTLTTGATIIRNEFENELVDEKPYLTITQKAKIRYDYLYIPLSFNYNISNSNTDFLLSLGLFTATGFNLINKEEKIYSYPSGEQDIYESYALEVYTASGDESAIRKIDIGFLLGTEVQTPLNDKINFIAGIRFNSGIGISQNLNVGASSRYLIIYTGIAI